MITTVIVWVRHKYSTWSFVYMNSFHLLNFRRRNEFYQSHFTPNKSFYSLITCSPSHSSWKGWDLNRGSGVPEPVLWTPIKSRKAFIYWCPTMLLCEKSSMESRLQQTSICIKRGKRYIFACVYIKGKQTYFSKKWN